MKKVAILTYDGAALFELGCAVELFALPRPELDAWYDTDVVSFENATLRSTAGVGIRAKSIDSLSIYDMLVIPSWPTTRKNISGLLAENIKQFQKDKKRIISFCSGAFLLADLGILADKPATTHWRYSEKFKQRYPSVNYVDNVLYIYDGIIGCSAGSAAALDLGIEVIRQDYGQLIAAQVARRLVVSAHRKGGQAQFVETPRAMAVDQFGHALQWALENLGHSFGIDLLATKANMSRRSFDRKFRLVYKETPKTWLTRQRIDLAKQLLESHKGNIDQIADLAGFDNATTLRHHFRKNLGVSPRQYRDQFAA